MSQFLYIDHSVFLKINDNFCVYFYHYKLKASTFLLIEFSIFLFIMLYDVFRQTEHGTE